MKKIILLFSIVIVLSGCTTHKTGTPVTPTSQPQPPECSETTLHPTWTPTCIETTLKITDPKPNEKVSLPFTIDGTIETPTTPGCKRWIVFEAQAGMVEIQSKDGKVIHSQPFPIEGEWMTEEPLPFSIVITSENISNQEVNIVFKSDNPSGLPENDQQYTLPVEIN